MKIVLLINARFKRTCRLRSNLGFVIMKRDKHGVSNIIHYASERCKRVTRSVMASEVHVLLLGFDNSFEMLEEILCSKVQLKPYLDSKNVFDVIEKVDKTKERRLQIDISSLRGSYANMELTSLGWMPGGSNPVDQLSKTLISGSTPLFKLMTHVIVELSPVGLASVSNRPQ